MDEGRALLQDLALALGVAAVTTVVFRKLRQPVVLGYLLAGLIVGPHIPIPLVADEARVHTLSELGVILVMFSVGLELSVRKLLRVLPTSGVVALVSVATMTWLGYLVGRAFGWSAHEGLFTGALVSISSTMIVAKVFAEQRVPARVVDTVFGVLIVQDIAAILILALLTTVASGQGLEGIVLVQSVAQLLAFLVVIVAGGFLVVPRVVRAVARLESPETLLVTSVGVCFGFALLAQKVGYSVALGAFVAGSLVAESGEGETVERLLGPLRDTFAAIFFVAVGMVLDPRVLLDRWPAVLALTLLVLVGQVTMVSIGSFLSGKDLKTSVQAGMSLAQVGEFSFIIVGVGVTSGVVGEFLYPVAVAVSILTSFTTPWLIRASGPVATFIDTHLPRPLQTFVSLYGSWVEQLRQGGARRAKASVGRLLRLVAVDVGIVALLVIGTAVRLPRLAALFEETFGVPAAVGAWVIAAIAGLLSLPFVFGVVRLARVLGVRLAEIALPPAAPGKLDLAAAPRRVLVVTVQLGVVVLVGVPLVAVTAPFVSPVYGVALLSAVSLLLGIAFWRSATNLAEHVRAGAQVIIEALGNQSLEREEPTLEDVAPLLPGLGRLTPVQLRPGSPAIGRTLIQINLRALSGASVITIVRGAEGIEPTGREVLEEGDVLAIAGSADAIAAATALLLEGRTSLHP